MNQSSVFQPPDRQRVDERIATTIADAILDGVFPPGSTLPPERDLAERLGVNRTSLRQGLARLQQMGLIEVRHGSGSVVRDPEGLTHPAVVEALVRKLGPDFLVELLEIRAALGPLIAAWRPPEHARGCRGVVCGAGSGATGGHGRGAAGSRSCLLPGAHPQHSQPRIGVALPLVEHAFGGREHALTGAYDDADPVLTDLRAINGAVLAGDPAAAAATVEAYLNASALRMVKSYRDRA